MILSRTIIQHEKTKARIRVKNRENRIGNIAHLDQRWTMRGWMIVSRRRARGRPRAPGRNGTASGGENPGLVAEQHFLDFLRTLADHLRLPEPFSSRSQDPRSGTSSWDFVYSSSSITEHNKDLCSTRPPFNTCTSFLPLLWISIIQHFENIGLLYNCLLDLETLVSRVDRFG